MPGLPNRIENRREGFPAVHQQPGMIGGNQRAFRNRLFDRKMALQDAEIARLSGIRPRSTLLWAIVSGPRAPMICVASSGREMALGSTSWIEAQATNSIKGVATTIACNLRPRK